MKWCDAVLSTPAENLACDEALLDRCEERREEILRFWESRQHFVVVGYGNSVAAEVNVSACARLGVPILRRCSGGGTVVQGPGCLSYNLTLRIAEDGPLATVAGANEFIMERHRAALARLLGRPVAVKGHTDLAFEDGGRWLKFSGNAQRRRRQALVFHGTILHGFDLGQIDALLHFPTAQPDYRASRGHDEFVRNIPAAPAEIIGALCDAWAAKERLEEVPHDAIRRLCAEQYANEAWNRRR